MSNNNTIQDRYATRLAEDLDNNANEQEKVRVQLADLQNQLAQLEQERAWLTQLQGTVAGTQSAAAPEQPAGEAITGDSTFEPKVTPSAQPVPRPRGRKKPSEEPAARKAGKKAMASKDGRKPTSAASRSGAEPTLRSLVADILAASSEPRMVSEFVDTLARQHPSRATPSAPVVRNALESLVAKGLAERARQQGSVFYSPVVSAAPDAGNAVEAAAPEAAEPVPATA
ncbi:hypothetical protein [Actinacidiphila glaucinigra]|uniref:Regulatory protein n=1 Tax=Actinacidiphila glaucinigra TaxID=235986 RepID=A0A239MST7_9ACTN|nr:hypothetical protein [Actinacidiphila glaucinigra]SNT45313.1 hypothetical protein SAMN05216252_126128 [Actinacidiphila glaucinigra]